MKKDVARERVTYMYYDHLLPLHKRQCLITSNLPSLHPLSFHEMIFIHLFEKDNKEITMTIINITSQYSIYE